MPVPPRTAPREANRIREVFVSATAKDAAVYRTNVKDVLELIKTAVFLQESWASPAAGVVTLCLNRLKESDAYLGVFGFRYGWIPEHETRSITEIECDAALQLWKKATVPPVFFFAPEPGSQAADDLEAAAAAILDEDFPADEAKRAENRRLQKAFCDRIRSSGRFAGTFVSVQDLRERAQASVSNWNVEILERASRDRQPGLAHIPPSALGAIDREPQRKALESALLGAGDANAAGLCVVVHGGEDAGQFAFLSYLERWDDWDISAKPHLVMPPHDRFDAASVIAAALAEIAPDRVTQTASAEDLGHAIADRCRDEKLVMFLPNLDRMDGGLASFHQVVWTPVLTAARDRRRAIGAENPFIVVTSIASPQRAPLPAYVWSDPLDAPDVDWDRLLLLPELGNFSVGHVRDWLKDHDHRKVLSLQDRKDIADRVTKDGVPRAVFDRLNGEGIWNRLNR